MDELLVPESGPARKEQLNRLYRRGSYRAMAGRSDGAFWWDTHQNVPLPRGWRGVLHTVGTDGLIPEEIRNVSDGLSQTIALGEMVSRSQPNRGTFWAYTYACYNKSAATPYTATLLGDYWRCRNTTGLSNPCKRAWGSLSAFPKKHVLRLCAVRVDRPAQDRALKRYDLGFDKELTIMRYVSLRWIVVFLACLLAPVATWAADQDHKPQKKPSKVEMDYSIVKSFSHVAPGSLVDGMEERPPFAVTKGMTEQHQPLRWILRTADQIADDTWEFVYKSGPDFQAVCRIELDRGFRVVKLTTRLGEGLKKAFIVDSSCFVLPQSSS